jgi:HD-like signal output (HDOD) protein
MVDPAANLHSSIKPKDLLASLGPLASPPEIYQKITRLMDDPETSFADIAAVLEIDTSLTARLLKIVNSPFYGMRSQIATVQRAITVVGTRELRDLVLGTVVMTVFSGLKNDFVSMDTFWRQSLRCAILARIFTSYHQDSDTADTLFTAGILHDIGHLIMYNKIPELVHETIVSSRFGNLPVHLAENHVIGFNYTDVGGELMSLWSLPEILRETVAMHQTPENAKNFPVETAIIHLASGLKMHEHIDMNTCEALLIENARALKLAGIRKDVFVDAMLLAEKSYQQSLNELVNINSLD